MKGRAQARRYRGRAEVKRLYNSWHAVSGRRCNRCRGIREIDIVSCCQDVFFGGGSHAAFPAAGTKRAVIVEHGRGSLRDVGAVLSPSVAALCPLEPLELLRKRRHWKGGIPAAPTTTLLLLALCAVSAFCRCIRVTNITSTARRTFFAGNRERNRAPGRRRVSRRWGCRSSAGAQLGVPRERRFETLGA